MQYCNLGQTAMRVSRICFGCAGIGGYDYGPTEDDESLLALRTAVEHGINFFDVADIYGFGRSETLLRRAMGRKVGDVVVATKFGVHRANHEGTYKDISPAAIRRALEGSLKRLGLEAIPLYQIHWPDGKTVLEDCVQELEEQRLRGKVLAYGICNHTLNDVERALQAGRLESLQLPYSVIDRSFESQLKHCSAAYGISTMIYNALGHGLLSGKYDVTAKFSGTDMRTRLPLFDASSMRKALSVVTKIKNIAAEHDCSPSEIALAWCLMQPGINIAIAGCKTAQQVKLNAQAANRILSAEQLNQLESIGNQ